MVRHTLVYRQLATHLPDPPARIADIGGGAGQQALPLARMGYEIIILDPSPTMLQEARRALASEEEEVRRQVRLVKGEGERAGDILDSESFDAVLCQGVLMYLEDPRPMIEALAAVAHPGAVISVLTKNDALSDGSGGLQICMDPSAPPPTQAPECQAGSHQADGRPGGR